MSSVALRPAVWRQAVPPTLRAVPLALALAGPAVGLVVLVSAWWFDSTDPTGPLVGAALLSGCTLGYALDDPASATLAPSPTTLLGRRGLATLPILLITAVVWWVEVRVARQAAPVDAALLDRATLEVLTAAALALGLSAFGAARLDSTSGGTVGLFGSLSAAALLFTLGPVAPASWRIPSLLPDPHPERWLWLAAAGLALFAWCSRDPASRLRTPET